MGHCRWVVASVVDETTMAVYETHLFPFVCIGQEEYDRLRTLSYENTHIVLLCFSVDNRVSLDNILERWLPEISDHCPRAKLMLLALKCDLRDEDPTEDGATEPVMYDEVKWKE